MEDEEGVARRNEIAELRRQLNERNEIKTLNDLSGQEISEPKCSLPSNQNQPSHKIPTKMHEETHG